MVNIIYGAPGTGKTTYLMGLLEKLLKEYAPEEIAFVSYTRKGTYEGLNRAMELFNIKKDRLPYFKTLHSIAFSQLGMQRHNIISKWQYREFSKHMGMNFLGYYTEDLINVDDKYLFFDGLQRNNPESVKHYLYDMDTDKLKFVLHNYRRFKEFSKIFDFTDLLEKYIKECPPIPVKVAIVDEAQDLSTLQWKMVWKAFGGCKDVYIAGDDDQAIYEWSGADVPYFLNLKGNITILKKSYRLPQNILDFSEVISSQIKKRVSKELSGVDTKGEIKFIGSMDEVTVNPEESYLFLSRNNFYLRDMEAYLNINGVTYYKKGDFSVNKMDANAIRDYIMLQKTKDMKYLTTPLKNRLREGYSFEKPFHISMDFKDAKKQDYYKNVVEKGYDLWDSNVTLGTIHSVKGGEADNVILTSNITKNVYRNLEENPDSEHRVFYVGCTRTKKRLIIMNATSKYEYKFYRRERRENK